MQTVATPDRFSRIDDESDRICSLCFKKLFYTNVTKLQKDIVQLFYYYLILQPAFFFFLFTVLGQISHLNERRHSPEILSVAGYLPQLHFSTHRVCVWRIKSASRPQFNHRDVMESCTQAVCHYELPDYLPEGRYKTYISYKLTISIFLPHRT